VLVGLVSAGQTIEFGMSTLWVGQTYYAFSGNSDQASTVAFTDVCNVLGMNGKIIQQTGPATWLMHLNDAAHYTISKCEANNILVQIRLAPACSLKSLSGAYSYVFKGTKSVYGDDEHARSFSAVGRLVADGSGTFTAMDTESDGGRITRGNEQTGTYTVNDECIGTVTFSGLGQMDLVITDNNQRVDFIGTVRGSNLIGGAQQQFH
jgi:hypothetical protein